MKKAIWACTFLVGALFCLGQQAIGAERECNVFGSSRWGGEQMYRSCEDCLQQSQRCETRCFESNTACMAVGYDRYGFRSTIQGEQAKREERARKKALRQCQQQGLNGCDILRCTEEQSFQPVSVEVCQSRPQWGNGGSSHNWGGAGDNEYRCGIFPKSPRAPQREYQNCNVCERENGQCEERCAQSGYVCTATGYAWRGFPQTIQGDLASNQRRAERKAMRKCSEAGLNRCSLGQCRETIEFDPQRTTPCKTQNNNNRNKKKKKKKKKPNTPVVHQPTQRYVTSWQHLKGRCQGSSYHKVAKQCGGRGVWHGIYCRVTWSDGRTEDLHGKVDLKDPYGRAYCTRRTRPAHFNCVSRCDNTNGPLMNLPRP